MRIRHTVLKLDRIQLVTETGHIMEMTASEFKAKCLKLIDRVGESGEPIIISKHGRPVARLVPEG